MESRIVFLFTTHPNKITCHEKKLNFFFQFCQKRVLTSLAMMYMLIYCIYTRYIDAFIKIWTQDLMEAHHDVNHQINWKP